MRSPDTDRGSCLRLSLLRSPQGVFALVSLEEAVRIIPAATERTEAL